MRVYTVEFLVSSTWVEESAYPTPGEALNHLAEIIEILPGGSIRLNQRLEIR